MALLDSQDKFEDLTRRVKAEAGSLMAHVKQSADGEWLEPHCLIDHLYQTALLAGNFVESFSSTEWGIFLGLLHDVGKSTCQWQDYLLLKSGYGQEAHMETHVGKLDHSSSGSKLAEDLMPNLGRLMAYSVSGHHAGLPDFLPDKASKTSCLAKRLERADTSNLHPSIVSFITQMVPSSLPWKFSREQPLDLPLWIRMLFSCLVDADFLDTESYMDPEKFARRSSFASIPELLVSFNNFIDKLSKSAAKTNINRLRAEVLADCRQAAVLNPGFFSLTVPTGGGKTLSSMAFALEHCLKHGLERVIFVIPYTSIIEQNADVFRQAVGGRNVVEHHSAIGEGNSSAAMRLAAENWDAPIIVTTNVQFFESLFAAKPSRCRKLHNIARSVVVLDEAQLLPTDYMEPILQAMNLLCSNYSVSFVISTATQPALEARQIGDWRFKGLPKSSVREIVPDVAGLYRQLKRVDVILPEDFNNATDWEDVAAECAKFRQVLCVVSDRKSCRKLYELVKEIDSEGTIHLSALMCGQHRSDVIAKIKERLSKDLRTRVVSTQLVEAGVDLDFPVVMRAMAGLDSIAQAAGRCNREGILKLGRVIVFIAPRKSPPGLLRKAADASLNLLRSSTNKDPMSRENFADFFNKLYCKVNSLDAREIINLLKPDDENCGIQFRTAAAEFKLIDDSMQRNILVRYKKSENYIKQLKAFGPNPEVMRKLQRYSVNIYINDFNVLLNRKSIEEIIPGVFVLITDMEYSDHVGLLVDDSSPDPESLVL